MALGSFTTENGDAPAARWLSLTRHPPDSVCSTGRAPGKSDEGHSFLESQFPGQAKKSPLKTQSRQQLAVSRSRIPSQTPKLVTSVLTYSSSPPWWYPSGSKPHDAVRKTCSSVSQSRDPERSRVRGWIAHRPADGKPEVTFCIANRNKGTAKMEQLAISPLAAVVTAKDEIALFDMSRPLTESVIMA